MKAVWEGDNRIEGAGRDKQSDHLHLQHLHQRLQGEHLQARDAEVGSAEVKEVLQTPGCQGVELKARKVLRSAEGIGSSMRRS